VGTEDQARRRGRREEPKKKISDFQGRGGRGKFRRGGKPSFVFQARRKGRETRGAKEREDGKKGYDPGRQASSHCGGGLKSG